MEQSDAIPLDNQSISSDLTESSCRSRTGSIKTKQLLTEDFLENDTKKRQSRIRRCIAYFLLFLLASAAVGLPVIMILMKRTPVYRVTHRSTQKPVTASPRTRLTSTVISTTTAKPIDQCERTFVAVTKNMERYVSTVDLADLNNDNNTDMVFICENQPLVYIIFNMNKNQFAPWISYPTSHVTYSFTIADINQDNAPDIIVGLASGSYQLQILINDGYGGYNTTIDIPIDSYEIVYSILATDINNDANIDIIFTFADGNMIEIILNKGDLMFDEIQNYTVGQLPISIYADDYNGDEQIDLIVPNTHEHTIEILFNDGHGRFDSRMTYSVDYGPVFIRSADLNKDNRTDLIVVNYFSNNVVIYLNTIHGNFSRYFNISANANPLTIALNDYDHDGSIDIIVPNYHSNSIDVFFNDGNGIFQTTASYIVYPLPRHVVVADMNDDGKSDIVLANGNYVGIILSRCYF